MKVKRIFITSFLVFIILLGIGLGLKSYFGNNLQRIAEINIEEINFSKLKDGVYEGEFSAFPVSAKVKVSVKSNKVTEITLVSHKNGQGKAAEIIPDIVVQKQSLKVDVITGATYSSKVILKAIEDAIKKGE